MAVKGVDRQLGDSSVVDKTYNISYYIICYLFFWAYDNMENVVVKK